MALLLSIKRDVNVSPGAGTPAIYHASQGDIGTRIILGLINDNADYTIPEGTTAIIRGTRGDGTIFEEITAEVATTEIKFNLTEDMTSVPGPVECEAVMSSGSANVLGTANFIIDVEQSSIGDAPAETTDATWNWILNKLSTEQVAALGDDVIGAITTNAEDIDTLEHSVASAVNGTPVAVSLAALMTDTTKIYLYTGSEDGYTAGNWYYYDGSAWVSGGVYGTDTTDATLTISGAPADAKATGDAVSALNYKTNALANGTPAAVATVAEMTETTNLYVYTGSESGYTAGHWYYYDGSAWTDGGSYGYAQVDSSLTIENVAAESKTTGSKITAVTNLAEDIYDSMLHDYSLDFRKSITADITANYGKAIMAKASASTYGQLVTSSSWTSTDYIACSNYAYIRFTLQGLTNAGDFGLVWYDSEQSPIGGFTSKGGGRLLVVQDTAVPTGAAYFRTCVLKDFASGFYVMEGLPGIEPLTNLISKGSYINMYDPDDTDIVTGQEILYDGTTQSSDALCVSGYIPTTHGKTYIFPFYRNHFGTSSNATYVNYYDSSKARLGSTQGTIINTNFLKVTFPSAAAYFRVNAGTIDVNTNYIITPYHSGSNFMVIVGDTMPSTFVPYEIQYEISENTHSLNDDVLYSKKVVFLGDSICEGDSLGGWAGRIGRGNKMLWENDGIGGSTISTVYPSKTICTRTILMNSPDYVIFEGGTNDADRIGSIISGSTPAAYGSYSETGYGTTDASTYYGFDIDTFCGAFEYLCKRLISAYPGAKIGYILAHKMGREADYTATGNNRRAYFAAAEALCKKWGIPYINLWDGCYLNPMIPQLYTEGETDGFYLDGQHLTAKGYDYISPMIEAWMKTL